MIANQSCLGASHATTGSGVTLANILADLDARPTPAGYMRAARMIGNIADRMIALRVSLLSSYTINALVPYLVVEGAREGFKLEISVGPFNSVAQELLDPNSLTANFQPEIVVIAQLLEDISPALSHDFLSSPHDDLREEVASLVTDLIQGIEAFRQRHASGFVIHNFGRSPSPMLGVAEAITAHAQSEAVRETNAALSRSANVAPDTLVLDFDLLSASVGYNQARDNRSWYMGHAPLSAALLPALAREHAQIFRVMRGKPRKCLVLDLDNTLWGGVIGEEGLAGIHVGDGYPGNIFRDFQRRILQLHRRGVLLAINSKNNEADALEVFRSRPEMILGIEDFAAVRMNWNDKPANMLSIADELGIGVDSLVFFDDNPVERALMQEVLPEVLTLDVPAEPMQFVELLDWARPFDRPTLMAEDARRGEIQRAEKERRGQAASSGSLAEFLEGLKMQVDIHELNDAELPRVADLFQKTNQFNVTTHRHSATQLAAMNNDSNIGVFSLRASDRFGDHGLVGAAIVRVENDKATIDSLLLSCRVIGRGVESALVSHLAHWALTRGAVELIGEFIPTARNAPAASFYHLHGFSNRENIAANDVKSTWNLDLRGVLPSWPTHITRYTIRAGADGMRGMAAS